LPPFPDIPAAYFHGAAVSFAYPLFYSPPFPDIPAAFFRAPLFYAIVKNAAQTVDMPPQK